MRSLPSCRGKAWACVALAVALAFCLSITLGMFEVEGARALGPGSRKVKNVILMISDGCGYNHIEATNYYEAGRKKAQAYERFPVRLGMSTYEYELVDGVYKLLGLELGADDYVTKPFNMRELVARVRAVLRRAGGKGDAAAPAGSRMEVGEIVLDMDRHEVTVEGVVVEMPLTEYRLLELFMRNPGKALGREYLLNKAWEGDFYGQTKTLDVHIRRLREKIEKDPANPRHIITVRGVGYRFEAGGAEA